MMLSGRQRLPSNEVNLVLHKIHVEGLMMLNSTTSADQRPFTEGVMAD